MNESNRILYVAICETRRRESKKFGHLIAWNETGYALRSEGETIMINLCRGIQWKSFITKSLSYLSFLKELSEKYKEKQLLNVYVIFMDSDTMWSTSNISQIWMKFDKVRQNKHIVVSTEMNCWVGGECTQEELEKWYEPVKNLTSSYSLFVNSGLLMGRVDRLTTLYEYILENQDKYQSRLAKYFSDQYAITDYSLSIAPQEVQLDFQQELFANSMVVSSTIKGKYFCRFPDNELKRGCRDISGSLLRGNYYNFDEISCTITRHLGENLADISEIQHLAPDPVAWHFPGKHAMLLMLLYRAYQCVVKKRHIEPVPYHAAIH